MEKWKAASIPHRFLSSIIYQLAPLAVLDYGGGPKELSLSFFFMYVGLMLGNIVWTKVLSPRRRHTTGILLGHLALIIPLLALTIKDVNAALISSFLIAFISPISYFSGLFYAYDKLEDSSIASSSYESVSGWAWFSGLVAGGVALNFLSINMLALAGIILDLALLPVIAASLGINVIRILRKIYEEEIGVLPVIEDGLEAVQRAEEEALEWTLAQMSRVTRGTLFQRPSYLLLGIPRKGVPFSFKVFLAFIGLGFAYPQLIGLQKSLGLNNSEIFMLSALSSFISSIFYSRAGKGEEVKNLNYSAMMRSLMLLSIPIAIAKLAPPLEYFMAFMILDGATWSFILVSISRRGLKVSLEYLGKVNFIRSLGWSIGALLGGFTSELIGLTNLYILSAILIFLSSIIKTKKVEFASRKGLLPPK